MSRIDTRAKCIDQRAAAGARCALGGVNAERRQSATRHNPRMTSPAGKPATIMQKARRKISLPWFKQTSSAAPHPALSRQHTIDTPGSFQARLLRQQPSLSQVPGTPPDLPLSIRTCLRLHLTTINRVIKFWPTPLLTILPRTHQNVHFYFIL